MTQQLLLNKKFHKATFLKKILAFGMRGTCTFLQWRELQVMHDDCKLEITCRHVCQ